MPSATPTQRASTQPASTGETQLGLTRRVRRITRALAEGYPGAHCELDFTTPLELLVAVVLSAQCTDVRVNQTTPALFARYRSAADYAGANRVELEEMIRPTGFFRNKATSLIGLGAALVERFDGAVPGRLEDLVTLPGVGRKTANVVLGDAFGVPGITVDTHFGRLVRRWGWTEEEDPVKVEHAIGALVPRKEWTVLSHRVIFHGRRVCHARRPACGACLLAKDCPSFGLGPVEAELAAPLVKGEEAEHLLALAQRTGLPKVKKPATVANPAKAAAVSKKPANSKTTNSKAANNKAVTSKTATSKTSTSKTAAGKAANNKAAASKAADGKAANNKKANPAKKATG